MVKKRGEDFMFIILAIVIVVIIYEIAYFYGQCIAPKKAEEQAKINELEEIKWKEKCREEEEEKIAHEKGLDKIKAQIYSEVHKKEENLRGVAAKLKTAAGTFSYQEKETSWAIMGGIADGIAGPAAGIAAALETEKENEKIRERNAERQALSKQLLYESYRLSMGADRDNPMIKEIELLKKEAGKVSENYCAIFTWSPITLLAKLNLKTKSVYINSKTGSVTVTTAYSKKEKDVVIDGSVRAKLYTEEGICAGCVYIVLPKYGVVSDDGTVSGVCANPIKSKNYTVVYEAIDLWELKKSYENYNGKTKEISQKEHEEIVEKLEEDYQTEFSGQAINENVSEAIEKEKFSVNAAKDEYNKKYPHAEEILKMKKELSQKRAYAEYLEETNKNVILPKAPKYVFGAFTLAFIVLTLKGAGIWGIVVTVVFGFITALFIWGDYNEGSTVKRVHELEKILAELGNAPTFEEFYEKNYKKNKNE